MLYVSANTYKRNIGFHVKNNLQTTRKKCNTGRSLKFTTERQNIGTLDLAENCDSCFYHEQAKNDGDGHISKYQMNHENNEMERKMENDKR